MRRALHVALGSLAVLAAALALAVGAFLWGLDVDGEFLRAPLERVLTGAFDVPTRIEGPLKLHTGRAATVSADALVLADPSGPAGATLARGISPRARIDLGALLGRSVALEEVTGDRLELTLRRYADGRANWALLFSSSGDSSPVSFAGIARLRIGSVVGTYKREDEQPVPFAIREFDGAVPLDDPLAASGAAQIAGQEIGFDLRTESLAGLTSTAAGIALQGTLQWSGVRATIDGRFLEGGTRFETSVEATAADASAALTELGIAAHEPGPLTLRGRLTATATQATARDLAVSLGKSSASGSASIAWGRPTASIAIDLTGERVDAAPFLNATPLPKGTRAAEEWVARLERLATATDATVKLDVDEFSGLPVTAKKIRLDIRSGDRALAATATAVVAGTPIDATLDYDARKPQHTLAARIDSGAASTASLPGAARPADLAVTAGSVRGRLRGQGANPAAIAASLQGEFDARNLRWTYRGRGRPPIAGRFDVVHIALQPTTASSAEVSGKIDGASCGLRISGGAPAPLLSGQPWPVQFSATCPHERVNAKGRIALAGRHATADLTFDVAGDRSGPVARAVGLPPGLPYPITARGTLVLDDKRARLRLAAVRLGRTAGSGEIDYPLGAAGTPRLRLALATLNLDEIEALGETGPAPDDPFDRIVLRRTLRLRDADIDIAADRVDFRNACLRRFSLQAAVRAHRTQASPFRIEWSGMALRGQVSLDFSGASPRVQIDGTAQDADLYPLLAAIGAADLRVRAGRLSVSAQAQGERLRELLASATLDAAVDRAQVELQRPLLAGATGRGLLDATFKAGPGQPSEFTARGQIDGRQIDLAADGPPVDALARNGATLPLALRSTIGDVRLEADGRFARDGSGEARVRLAGGRLEDLGALIGLALPEVAPYAASARVSKSPGTLDLSELEASFGRSRVAGSVRVEQREGGRALHTVTLRAPVLHLEDIGAGRWLSDRDPKERASPESAARNAQAAIERLLELLPRADVEASVELDELLGGGQPFTSGQVLATVNAGALRARLLDVQAQDGTANAELAIDAGASPPRFSLRADVRDVEYGALLRAMSPASQLDGQLDIVADLSAQGAPADLLQALQGTVDVAVYPRGMKSDALGLWGAGLLPAILRAVDRDSQAQVQCSVLGFAVADGVARSDGFFVETTSVRIVGDLEVQLGSWEISGRIDPRSNTPQLFAIAPRMQIGGAVGSPTLSASRENVVLVPLRFASPLSLFSRDWLGRGSRRAGGKAGCREAFERVLETHHGQAGSR